MTTSRTPPPSPPDRQGAPRKADRDGMAGAREARLKAALKANMARRKAQARARSGGEESSGEAENKE